MSLRVSLLAAAMAFSALPALASPVTVDLSTWTGDGSPWTLTAGNNTATQTTNSPTGVLSSGLNDLLGRYTGTLSVNTSQDDDFVGFVLGYNPGDLAAPGGTPANSSIDYLLVDWKQRTQSNADSGMAVSRVTGNSYVIGDSASLTTASDAWTHTGVVSELERANTLGSTGWVDNIVYNFQVDYTSTLLQVFINGVLEIDLTPSEAGMAEFNAGSFGFYSFSQEQTEFAAIEYSDLSIIPLPAGLPLALGGLGALAMLRRRAQRKG